MLKLWKRDFRITAPEPESLTSAVREHGQDLVVEQMVQLSAYPETTGARSRLASLSTARTSRSLRAANACLFDSSKPYGYSWEDRLVVAARVLVAAAEDLHPNGDGGFFRIHILSKLAGIIKPEVGTAWEAKYPTAAEWVEELREGEETANGGQRRPDISVTRSNEVRYGLRTGVA